MKKEYLLSIVVPTKNRYKYLKYLIQLIKGFQSDDIELVIQDNTEDNKEILEYIKKENFVHLKYYHSTDHLSVSQNSDLAILNSTGKYVCFIGDDDGVTKYIVDCCKWMDSMDIECVVPNGYVYRWPDVVSKDFMKGTMLYKIPQKNMHILRTSEVLDECMSNGMINRGSLPLLYHGIVKRTTLDKICDTCGSYFPGASPDIANGVALCLVMDKFASTTFPYAYSGASQHLGGGAAKLKYQATTNFRSLPFLPEDIEQIWNPRIPKVWAECTIWCESATEAMHRMNRDDLVGKVNYEALYVQFVSVFHFYRSYAYELTSSRFNLFMRSVRRILVIYWNKVINRMKRILSIHSGSFKIHHNLKNILESNKFLESICEEEFVYNEF